MYFVELDMYITETNLCSIFFFSEYQLSTSGSWFGENRRQSCIQEQQRTGGLSSRRPQKLFDKATQGIDKSYAWSAAAAPRPKQQSVGDIDPELGPRCKTTL